MSDGTFALAELQDALRPFMPLFQVEDTGGGCLVVLARREPNDTPVSLGPGWLESPQDGIMFRWSDLYVCTEDDIGPHWAATNRQELVKYANTARALYNNGRDHWTFTAEDILVRLRLAFPGSYCDQTGGSTATLKICKDAADPKEIPVVAGPGQFHWNAPGESTFHTGEFSAGMDYYINSTDQLRDDDETGPEVPIGDDWIPTPENLDNVARLIAEYHGIYNNGSYPN